MVTQELVKELFDYREDGNLIRKKRNQRHISGVAIGSKPAVITRNRRYSTTKIFGEHWCVHKLIYLFHHGYVPEQLDHINRNTLDNRIENLRPATRGQNMMNRTVFANNRSGVRGVYWNKRTSRWHVTVYAGGKCRFSRGFADIELAELVAIEARDKYHGAYVNHA